MSMTINELCDAAHEQAKESEFYENDDKIGSFLAGCDLASHVFSMRTCQLLLLIIREITEAMEADRSDKYCGLSNDHVIELTSGELYSNEVFQKIYNQEIKDTFEDELAGACLRIFDLCGYLGIDLESHIQAAMRYNSLREAKHGKKY